MHLPRAGCLRVLAIVMVAMLAGCGADGEPVRPSLNAGVGISADGGVNVGGGVALKKGPISVFFGF